MNLTTLSDKNQIVIPKSIRDSLGIKAGACLEVMAKGDLIILVPLKISRGSTSCLCRRKP